MSCDADGIYHCDFPDCVVKHDPKIKECQPTIYSSCVFPQRALCEEHESLAAQVAHELPLAIQELHAHALIFQAVIAAKFEWSQADANELGGVRDRVRHLRDLEAQLKGSIP